MAKPNLRDRATAIIKRGGWLDRNLGRSLDGPVLAGTVNLSESWSEKRVQHEKKWRHSVYLWLGPTSGRAGLGLS